MYHFVNFKHSNDDDQTLDLPDSIVSFSAKYPTTLEATWCLCDSEFNTDDIAALNLETVSNELTILLNSAKLYAPAYALAFSKVNALWPQSKAEYEQNLINVLKQYLANQSEHGFFLCESKIEETGYLSTGEFVWIVKYIPEIEEILWISSDYEIYQDPIAKFNLNPLSLSRLNAIQLKSLTSC